VRGPPAGSGSSCAHQTVVVGSVPDRRAAAREETDLTRRGRLGVALLVWTLASPAAAQEPGTDAEEPAGAGMVTSGAVDPPLPTAIDEEPYDYVIAPGDVLRIMVWKEPTLSTDAPVRLDGKITVPLMGDMVAEGRTPDELSIKIRGGLMAFLEVPQVTVSVAQALSARFYVVGEVAVSSVFPLNGRITVLQALATAGGFKEFARRDRIMIVRKHRGVRQAIPFNYDEIEQGLNLEQNIVLKPGDTVIVP
jgi:polysaccharide export outer membrane protein